MEEEEEEEEEEEIFIYSDLPGPLAEFRHHFYSP